MGPTSLRTVALLVMTFVLTDQPANPQPKAGAAASGVFVGRSGKPMANTRMILAEVTGDQEVIYAKIKLAVNPPIAVTDDKGQFQFRSFIPGMYAVLYSPAPASKVLPAEINIKALAAVAKSPFPLLRDTQIGDTGTPYPDRLWGRTFTLLKGHTFFAEGANMKIWNARSE